MEIKRNMRDGIGDIEISHVVEKGTLGRNCRLFAQITIKPGDSIGTHQHTGEQEIFYFIQGKGTVMDNGRQIEICAGDVMVTPNMDSHSVINTGDEDLVFMALILLQSDDTKKY
jgi:mannose-6-phosphate isomerase-like protein (cupin superfamily)